MKLLRDCCNIAPTLLEISSNLIRNCFEILKLSTNRSVTLNFRKHFQTTVRWPYTFENTFKKPFGYSKLSENTFDSPLGYSKKLTFLCVLHVFSTFAFSLESPSRFTFSSLLSLFRIVFRSLTAPLCLPSLSFRLSDLSLDAPGTLQSLPWVSRGSLFGSMAAPWTVQGRSRACFERPEGLFSVLVRSRAAQSLKTLEKVVEKTLGSNKTIEKTF